MKKPIYKKWWFWVIIIVVGLAIIGTALGDTEEATPTTNDTKAAEATSEVTTNISSDKEYQKVDLQTMMDELDENAMKAESKYQNAYIEITGTIASFDSDGSYITIEPIGASEWNFKTIMCYIKKSEQKDFLLEKAVGDTVTIKGKIFSIGEVIGYSMNIDSIS